MYLGDEITLEEQLMIRKTSPARVRIGYCARFPMHSAFGTGAERTTASSDSSGNRGERIAFYV